MSVKKILLAACHSGVVLQDLLLCFGNFAGRLSAAGVDCGSEGIYLQPLMNIDRGSSSA